MIDFRAICVVLFPETVLQETPWEWDTLHQQLPLGGKTLRISMFSAETRGSVDALMLSFTWTIRKTQENKLHILLYCNNEKL